METEGIYRLSGQHSRVTQLLKLLMEGINIVVVIIMIMIIVIIVTVIK